MTYMDNTRNTPAKASALYAVLDALEWADQGCIEITSIRGNAITIAAHMLTPSEATILLNKTPLTLPDGRTVTLRNRRWWLSQV